MLENETDEREIREERNPSGGSEQIPDVFISYSSRNKDVADAVVREYEAHGIRCWYAPRDILPGEEWVTAIHHAIDDAKLFVLLFTEQSNASRQVANEVALAFNSNKIIIPFRLSDTEMSTELEYYLTRVHWFNAVSEPLDRSVKDLREYSEKILSGETPIEWKDHNAKTSAKRTGIGGLSYERILIGILFLILLLILFILIIKDQKEKHPTVETSELTTQTGFVEESLDDSTGGSSDDSTEGNSKETSDGSSEDPSEFYRSGYYHQMEDASEDHFELAYEDYRKTGEQVTKDEKIIEAIYYLGKRFCDGDGVECDYQKAILLFEKASACGDTNSMNMLGNMYLVGDGVDEDPKMAEKYYRMAADLGDETGKKNLEYLDSLRGE